jgi:protein-tyrosine-phosphatase
MAQAIFYAEAKQRKMAVTVLSAGLFDFEGQHAVREAQLCCERHGTPLVNRFSTYFRSVDLTSAARIFVMTGEHVTLLTEANPNLSDRISLLGTFDPQHRGEEIEDPIGKEGAAFDFCYARLQDCINQYFNSTAAVELQTT